MTTSQQARRAQRLATVLVTTTLLLGGPAAVAAAESTPSDVGIGDSALRACIAEATDGDLTAARLGEVKALMCSAPGDALHPVRDVSGLDALTGLERLELTGYTFPVVDDRDAGTEDVSVVLPAWPSLTVLTITGAAHLPAALRMPKVTDLSLSKGAFEVVPVLDGLPRLKVVDLTGSRIPASRLTGLAGGVRVVGAEPEPTPEPEPETKPETEPETEPGAGPQTESPATADKAEEPAPPLAQPTKPRAAAAVAPPADDDVMPDGPLKSCLGRYLDEDVPRTFANTKTVTTVDVYPGCAGIPATTVLTDWTGWEFLPNVTGLYLTGLGGITFPAGITVADMFPRLTAIDLRNSNLKVLPALGALPDVTTLNLTGNKITELVGLTGLPKLATLTLTSNGLTKLESLGALTSLTTLSAGTNALTSVSALGTLPELTNLNLTGNKITEVSGLSGLPKLATLTLTNNGLTKLEGLGALTSLKTLSAGTNALTSVSALGTLPELTSLDVSSNQIVEISGLTGLPKLTTLTLTKNALTKLEGLGALTSLKTLSAGTNTLTSISALGELPELTTMDVSANKIVEVSGLTGLPKLTTLNLSNNVMTRLGSLSALTALTSLNASTNQLTTFPTLGTMAALTTLNLTSNQIAEVVDPAGLGTLTSLDMTGNGLVRAKGFGGFSSLTVLTLTNNKLTSLDELGTIPKLTRLLANNNLFTTVPTALSLPELTQMYVTDSKITKLAYPSAAGTPKLTTLDVRANLIADVTAAANVPGTLAINAANQVVTGPTVPALQPQPLASLLAIPAGSGPLVWNAGADNMAAINAQAGNYSAARAGSWRLTWASLKIGTVTYSGTVNGTATGDDALEVAFTAPGIVDEGQDAVYTANVTAPAGLAVSYQWYRGTNASNGTPVADATGTTFTIPAVRRSDNGAYVKLVVTTAGGAFQTTAVPLDIRPTIVDPGFKACLEAYFPDGYTITSLHSSGAMDCSRHGIRSIVDLPLLQDNVSVDLSGNFITDISPLVNEQGALVRRGQTNLSDNLIESIEPLGRATVDFASFVGEPKLNLDGNRISDVSPMNRIGAIPNPILGRLAVSALRQRVGVPGVPVNTPVTLPVALTTAGTGAQLSIDGTPVTGPTISFDTPGIKEVTWDVPHVPGTRATTDAPATNGTYGTAFGGSFVIAVGLGTTIKVDPAKPVGGHPMSVQLFGFHPGEEITVRWADGTILLSGRADGGGMLSYTAVTPYIGGAQVLTATDESGTQAVLHLDVDNDEVVDFPDPALHRCVTDALRMPADTITYRTRVDSLAGTFTCAGAGVTDLAGLESLPVTTVNLSGNNVTSLDTLATLNPVTTTLSLDRNLIDHLGTVAPQPNLTALSLSANQLRDFTALDGVPFAPGATITGYAQDASYPLQLLGLRSPSPTVPVLAGVSAEMFLPEDGFEQAGGAITWTKAGEHQIEFNLIRSADTSGESPTPGFRLTGTITVTVLDRGEPKVLVNPTKVFPTRMVNILATGFDPGEEMRFTLVSASLLSLRDHASPQSRWSDSPPLPGRPRADELGMVWLDNVLIGRDVPSGAYLLFAEGMDSGTVRSTELEVLPYPTVVVPAEPDDAGDDEGEAKPADEGQAGDPAVATPAVALAPPAEADAPEAVVPPVVAAAPPIQSAAPPPATPPVQPPQAIGADHGLTGLGWGLIAAAALAMIGGLVLALRLRRGTTGGAA